MMKNFEKELANAYGEAFDVEIDAIIAESEKDPHEFSPKFEESIAELIKTGKPKKVRKAPSKRGKRILIIAIAAVLALVATACAVPEIRESIAGFFVKVFGDHVEYVDPKTLKDFIEDEYALQPIPSGFEQTYYNRTEFSIVTRYEDTEGNIIKLTQVAGENLIDTVDNENGSFTELTIGSKKIRLYYSEESAQASWIEDGYYFSLDYTSAIEPETFEAWIRSVSR